VVGSLAYLATAGILGAREARRTTAVRAARARARANAAGPDPFHERLGDRPGGPPDRHLRPVDAGPGDESRPGQEEEEFDGPHSGGD